MTQRILPPPLRSIGLLVGLLAMAAVVWFGLMGGPGGLQVARECSGSQTTADRVAPFAKGELAALAVTQASKPVPDLAFQGPTGEAISLAGLKPKTILINVWATWCVPCRQEMPALDKLQAQLGSAEFEVVAINVDTRSSAKPKTWLQENGIHNLAYYADPSGKLLQVLQRSGHVVGLPTTLLVDGAGCEIALMKGPAEWASPEALTLVRTALGRPS